MPSHSSIVLELQDLAGDPAIDVGTLLRKALMVASKLGLKEFETWLTHELNGYPSMAETPEYREVQLHLQAFNPYRGLIPLMIEDERLYQSLARVRTSQALPALMAAVKSSGGSLQAPLSNQQQQLMMRMQDDLPMEVRRSIASSQIEEIANTVRNRILQWALRLESEGIMGKDLTFTRDEKRRAVHSPQISITNFQGVLGDVNHSQVTQQLSQRVSRGDFGALRRALQQHGIAEEDIAELESATRADPQEPVGGKLGAAVGSWLGKMVSKAASGAISMATDVAAKTFVSLIHAYYGLPH